MAHKQKQEQNVRFRTTFSCFGLHYGPEDEGGLLHRNRLDSSSVQRVPSRQMVSLNAESTSCALLVAFPALLHTRICKGYPSCTSRSARRGPSQGPQGPVRPLGRAVVP
jgi:hypothetical protein